MSYDLNNLTDDQLSQLDGMSDADFKKAMNSYSSSGNFTDASPTNWGNVVAGLASGGLSLAGGLLTGNAAKGAAKTSSDAQIRAAQIAADAAKFRPVGVKTNFGKSNVTYDNNGNLLTAGYKLSPKLQAQQNTLMNASNPLLAEYINAQGATAPMGQAAQSMFGLGQNYLGTTPQAQAQKYYNDQMALLQPSNDRQLAELRNTLLQQGRIGLSTGGTDTMSASNPEMEAYYNALLQQQNQLAANATQGGMDYTKFGAGLVGTGGDMLNHMFSTQANAFSPYQTAIGGATTLEGMGQNALDQSINIGGRGTAGNAAEGLLLGRGYSNAATTMQPANAYSPWGSLLSGVGAGIQNYMTSNSANNGQQYRFDPFTGRQL